MAISKARTPICFLTLRHVCVFESIFFAIVFIFHVALKDDLDFTELLKTLGGDARLFFRSLFSIQVAAATTASITAVGAAAVQVDAGPIHPLKLLFLSVAHGPFHKVSNPFREVAMANFIFEYLFFAFAGIVYSSMFTDLEAVSTNMPMVIKLIPGWSFCIIIVSHYLAFDVTGRLLYPQMANEQA